MATYDYTVIEDDAHASGDRLYPVGAVRNDSAATTLTSANGDYSPIAVDEKGRVFMIAGTGATDLAKAEDAAHVHGDTGIMMLAVSNAAHTALSGSAGDYTPIAVDAEGCVHVVTAAGESLSVSLANAVYNEDTGHTTGEAGVFMLAVRGDFGVASGAAGDYVAIPVGESSSIAGVQVHVVGDSDKYVRGSQAHNSALTVGPVAIGAYGSTAAPTAVGADGNLTYLWADRNGRMRVTGDASMTALKIEGTTSAGSASSTAILTVQGVASMTPFNVNGAQNHNVAQVGGPVVIGVYGADAAPTAITDTRIANVWGDRNGRVHVTGDASMTAFLTVGELAHDAVDSGNPNKLGMKAIAHGTNPTAVAANDRTQLYANRAGIPFVIGGHPNIVTLEYLTTGAQTNTAIVTVATGLKIVVTAIQVNVDAEVTVSPQVRIGFGTATTPTTTGVVFSHPGMGVGAGGMFTLSASRGDGSGIIGIGADDEDLRITCDAPTGGSIRVVVSYYTIES